jgi:CheY-like chemotaxis protein
MRPSVLVVEDDTATRTLLTVLIERCGFDVDVVNNGHDALTLLESVRYSALVCDLYMPVKSGTDVLAFIQSRIPQFLPRAIVVSAAPKNEVETVRQLYGIQTLRKPFDLDELTAAIIAAVNTSEPLVRNLPAEFCRRSILGGAKAGVVLTTDDEKHFDVPISYGYSNSMISRFHPISVDAPLPLCSAYRNGRAVWLSSPMTMSEFPVLTSVWKENQSYALAALPLTASGKSIGAVGWSFRTPRRFTAEERDKFESIAAFVSKELVTTAAS